MSLLEDLRWDFITSGKISDFERALLIADGCDDEQKLAEYGAKLDQLAEKFVKYYEQSRYKSPAAVADELSSLKCNWFDYLGAVLCRSVDEAFDEADCADEASGVDEYNLWSENVRKAFHLFRFLWDSFCGCDDAALLTKAIDLKLSVGDHDNGSVFSSALLFELLARRAGIPTALYSGDDEPVSVVDAELPFLVRHASPFGFGVGIDYEECEKNNGCSDCSGMSVPKCYDLLSVEKIVSLILTARAKRSDDGVAVGLLRTALEFSDSQGGRYNLATKLFDVCDYAAAEEELGWVLKADEDIAEAYALRSLCRLAVGNFEGAKKDAEAALSIDDEFGYGYFAEGLLFFEQQKWDRAARSFTLALEYGGPISTVLFFRGHVFEKLAKRHRAWYFRALEDYAAAFEFEPDFSDYLLLCKARVLFSLDNIDEAVDIVDSVLSGNPGIPEAYRILKKCYAALGCFDDAAGQDLKFSELSKRKIERASPDIPSLLAQGSTFWDF